MDERYMHRALALASLGRDTAPNPPVGAVIVCGDRIIGEGHHHRPGSAHAEVMALRSVHAVNRHLLTHATMYVTLEPCNHHGRTGPCSQAILAAGIARVVIGTADPNPHVHGSGSKVLEEAGVEVIMPCLANDAKRIIYPFYIWQTEQRPFVFLKYAVSSDGYMGIKDQSIWISGDAFGRKAHQWRSTYQAILVGTDTARIDDPSLTTRYASGPDPLRVILDRQGRLAADLQVFLDGRPTLLISSVSETLHASSAVHQIYLDASKWNWKSLLALLWDHGIYTLMIEGGRQILASIIAEELWDLAAVARSPKALHGGLEAPMPPSTPSHQETCGSDIVSYYQRATF